MSFHLAELSTRSNFILLTLEKNRQAFHSVPSLLALRVKFQIFIASRGIIFFLPFCIIRAKCEFGKIGGNRFQRSLEIH